MAYKTRLEDLALATGTLSSRQIRYVSNMFDRLDHAECRKNALLSAWIYLFSDVGNDRWRLANILAEELKRFEPVGYKRVLAGYRPSRGIEAYLAMLLDHPGPRCASKLYMELCGLPEPGQ